jgi:hypothetical protein
VRTHAYECDSSPITIDALSALLQSEVGLEALERASFLWDKEKVESQVQGLESCLSLVKLTFSDICTFSDEDGREDLATAFGDHLHKCQHIQQLCFGDCGFATCIASSALMPTASENADATNCTVLPLLVLKLIGRYIDIQGVLRPLTMRGSRLVELTLDGQIISTCLQLTKYIPELCRLRVLKLVFRDLDRWHFDLQSWLCGVRKNGSLHGISVSYAVNAQGIVPMHDVDCRKMQSWCDRNRWAPGLLQAAGSNKDNFEMAPTPLSLIPLLCKVLIQSPRLAPTFLFLGMLAADDAIGHIGRKKRVDSSTVSWI